MRWRAWHRPRAHSIIYKFRTHCPFHSSALSPTAVGTRSQRTPARAWALRRRLNHVTYVVRCGSIMALHGMLHGARGTTERQSS